MSPTWSRKEADSKIYPDVMEHSDGMISFTYRPTADADLDEAVKNTQTYRLLMKERAARRAKIADPEQAA